MRGTNTRERLLDAALALFADHGYTRTSVGEIEGRERLMPGPAGCTGHFASRRGSAPSRGRARDRSHGTTGQRIRRCRRLGARWTRGGRARAKTILADAVGIAFGMRSRYRLRRIFAGGDPIPADLAERFRDIVERTQANAAAGSPPSPPRTAGRSMQRRWRP